MARALALVLFCSLLSIAAGCAKKGAAGADTPGATNPPGTPDDSSASGAAAGSVGDALGATSANGTEGYYQAKPSSSYFASVERGLRGFFDFIPSVLASNACPTLLSAEGSGCTSVGVGGSSGGATLNLNGCTFGTAGTATWKGIVWIFGSHSGSAVPFTCGTFPSGPGTFGRSFAGDVLAATGANATVTTAAGTVVTVDNTTFNLGNYQGDTIVNGSGIGIGVNANGTRSGINVYQRVAATTPTAFDYSVTQTSIPSVTVTESAGATSRTVSGTMHVYDNTNMVKGLATFNTVGYEDDCCTPTSGSVSTAFAATSVTGPNTAIYDGKTETLTFTACGAASLVSVKGTTTKVNTTCY
jgi:hypothetical protein